LAVPTLDPILRAAKHGQIDPSGGDFWDAVVVLTVGAFYEDMHAAGKYSNILFALGGRPGSR